MGLFSNIMRGLTGGDNAAQDAGEAAMEEPVVHDGFLIHAAPIKEGSQWRLAGVITKDGNEAAGEHRFIRADTFSSRDDAIDWTVRKGKQIVDEQGDSALARAAAPDDQG